jgi:hypothetical protein
MAVLPPEEFSMKNKKVLKLPFREAGLLAIALVFGMTVVGCREAPDQFTVEVVNQYSSSIIDLFINGGTGEYVGYARSLNIKPGESGSFKCDIFSSSFEAVVQLHCADDSWFESKNSFLFEANKTTTITLKDDGSWTKVK